MATIDTISTWTCEAPDCIAHGTDRDSGVVSRQAEKHTKTTGHPTASSTKPVPR